MRQKTMQKNITQRRNSEYNDILSTHNKICKKFKDEKNSKDFLDDCVGFLNNIINDLSPVDRTIVNEAIGEISEGSDVELEFSVRGGTTFGNLIRRK